jgi:hypothetical protein
MEYAITWYPVHGMSESGPVEHEFTKCSLPTPSITFPGGIVRTMVCSHCVNTSWSVFNSRSYKSTSYAITSALLEISKIFFSGMT